MLRNIKFRGICIDENTINSGKFVYGYFLKTENYYYIIEVIGEDSFIWNTVNPETVGQYTGFIDKSGNEIYDGDILSGKEEMSCTTYPTQKTTVWTNDINHVVEYTASGLQLVYKYSKLCDVVDNVWKR